MGNGEVTEDGGRGMGKVQFSFWKKGGQTNALCIGDGSWKIAIGIVIVRFVVLWCA